MPVEEWPDSLLTAINDGLQFAGLGPMGTADRGIVAKLPFACLFRRNFSTMVILLGLW